MADDSWDTIVHFGHGKQRGAGHTGFYPKGNKSVFAGILWRGDSRGPEEVFKKGFTMHKAGKEVSGRVTSNVTGINMDKGTTRGGVSLSKCMVPAGVWAGAAGSQLKQDHGWLYVVYIQDEAWAAEIGWNAKDYSSPAARNEAKWQHEIMLREVKGKWIVAARMVKCTDAITQLKRACLYGPVKRNKQYKGPDVLITQKRDYSVDRFAYSLYYTPVIPVGQEEAGFHHYLDTL
jgi:hypothetical protein